MPSTKKLQKFKSMVRFATVNIRGGLGGEVKRSNIFRELSQKRIQVAAIQETWYGANSSWTGPDGATIIALAPREREQGYPGLAFYCDPKWATLMGYSSLVSHRVAVLRFKLRKRLGGGIFSIINAYAPAVSAVKVNPEAREAFYSTLRSVYAVEKREARRVMLMGDFNAKIGSRENDTETFLGTHGLGKRNTSGQYLQEFCEESGMRITNTMFQHRDHHKSTWHGFKTKNGTRHSVINNMIDYIITDPKMAATATDSRAYRLQEFDSDHSMVVGKFIWDLVYKVKGQAKKGAGGSTRINTQKLADSEDVQSKFREKLKEALTETIDNTLGLSERYSLLQRTLKVTALENIGRVSNNDNEWNKRITDDKDITNFNTEARRIRNRLKSVRNPITRVNLMHRRKELGKLTRLRAKHLREENLLKLATRMEASGKGNIRLFECQRLMRKQQRINFRLRNNEGFEYLQAEDKIEPVQKFYESFFCREGALELPEWRGDARPLDIPITSREVQAAAGRLNNNRAVGPDSIPGELLKYGGVYLHEEIAKLFNGIFETHETVPELKQGFLFPMNKPNKPTTAENTRPLVFLNTMRKVLSNIVLNRITNRVENYLPQGQHGFRRTRSCGEVVWSAQWISATAEKYAERIHLMSIDLSKAFDCLDRTKLIEIMKEHELGTEDDIRMITYLLSKTELKIKIGNATGPNFRTVIGTPQGDALSPILFLVYLEHILRKFRTENRYLIREQEYEFGYADDMYFSLRDKDDSRGGNHHDAEDYQFILECLCAKCRAHRIETTLPRYMQDYDMKMNVEKTFHTEWTKGMTRCTSVQMLGNNISPDFELSTRKAKATHALNMMHNTWLQKSHTVSINTKVYLYNVFVRPHLLYNAGSCPYTQQRLDKLDSFHRRQLRRVLGVFYPEHISNAEVYKKANVQPISVTIGTMRWAHLGHILRLNENAPAQLAMRNYFAGRALENGQPTERTATRSARLYQTLPRIININLRLLKNKFPNVLGDLNCIMTTNDLAILKRYAQNRERWQNGVVKNMEKALQQDFDSREAERKAKRDFLAEDENVELIPSEGNNAQPTGADRTQQEEVSLEENGDSRGRRRRRRQRGRPRTRPVQDPNIPRRPRDRPRTTSPAAPAAERGRRGRPSKSLAAGQSSSSRDIRGFFSHLSQD